MKDIETINGQISNIDRVRSSRNGNPRYRMTISSGTGDGYKCYVVYTTPDSSLGYTISNYRSGDAVTAEIGWHYGVLSLASID